MKNSLYFGDNLHVLREHIKDESVDLIYLDPPFNSKRDYSLLFKNHEGNFSDAQIVAFEDSWTWTDQTAHEFDEIITQSKFPKTAKLIDTLVETLGRNDMSAYLVMMANRLIEMYRVLKSTGSLYLHCDSTASHYLKLVLDSIFGIQNYRNEIIWKRTNAHNDATMRFSNITDTILFYAKSSKTKFNVIKVDLDQDYVNKFYKHKDDKGFFALDNLANPKPNGYHYDYKGYKPPANGWRCPIETMKKWESEGLIHFPENQSQRLRKKRYLTESSGMPISNFWDDIQNLQGSSAEKIGYPTQKPLELLKRIILASSNEGDVVLDPFCGCGTAVHASQLLKRYWIGIDITHLSVHLIEKRMKNAFPMLQDRSKIKKSHKNIDNIDDFNTYEVFGVPKDLDSAYDLAERDKYQFQWWACAIAEVDPYQDKKKGADGGIDGIKLFKDAQGKVQKLIVSVKGGKNVNVAMLRDLRGVIEREKAEIGVLISLFPPTKPMIEEALSAGFYKLSGTFGERKFPKLQILTIDDLLNDKLPDYPQSYHSKSQLDNFKQAKSENDGQDSLI